MLQELILLGTLVVTAYQPVPWQTKPECKGIHNCFTSIGDIPTKFGVAVSQDMLRDGRIHYGDPILIEGIGWKIVNDCMNIRHHNSIDIMVWSIVEERHVGMTHRRVWIIRPKGDTAWTGSHNRRARTHPIEERVRAEEVSLSDTTAHSGPK